MRISALSQMLIEGFSHLFLNRAPKYRSDKIQLYINQNITLITVDARLHTAVSVVHRVALPAVPATNTPG